jgi:hypothetical protein
MSDTAAELIMAAMRQADSNNYQKLSRAFPQTLDELERRYHSPGGFLEGEDHDN